jgi:hypothetical protein
MRAAKVTLTNETEGHIFSEFIERIEDNDLSTGDIYRLCASEYGRCQSKVYRDVPGGPPKAIGWFFVSRQEYTDTRETYLRGAWVTIGEYVPGTNEGVIF